MPINRIYATSRGKAAIAAVLIGLAGGAYGVYDKTTETVTIDGRAAPAPVVLAVEKLIKPWEAFRAKAYLDSVGVPTIGYGETQGVRLGQTITQKEAERLLYKRVTADYFQPIVRCATPLTDAPDSVQASMVSGAYNFGVRGWCGSTAARMIRSKQWRAACEAQTAWNKAGGKVLTGLVRRREMGDAQRLGEAELCVSGL